MFFFFHFFYVLLTNKSFICLFYKIIRHFNKIICGKNNTAKINVAAIIIGD